MRQGCLGEPADSREKAQTWARAQLARPVQKTMPQSARGVAGEALRGRALFTQDYPWLRSLD
jgi:hypothetical protein